MLCCLLNLGEGLGASLRGKKVAVSSAFDENTIRAIARTAHQEGLLVRRVIRNQMPVLQAARFASTFLPSARAVSAFATRQISRIEDGALPEDLPIAPLAEIARMVGARKRSFLTHSLGNARNKVMFDKAARDVDFGDADILISMPGSSLDTFRRNSHRVRVIHEIDAHPRVRNDLLKKFYGSTYARAETYPEWFVRRIEAEFDAADFVLVPGRVVAEQMRAHGVPDSKILQVPYGVDPSVFKPQVQTTTAPLAAKRRLRAVCTAQISLRKGIPFLLEAVRNQPIDLTLVGPVFDSRILKDLPGNVTLAGTLSAVELAALYANCDVFVLPSVEDCFSLVVAEAAGAGLPVITTRQNGAHEVLSDQHVVLEAGDMGVLRDALASFGPLSQEERLAISHRAIEQGWTDWVGYGTNVLRAIRAMP